MIKQGFGLLFLTLLAKVAGFLRDLVLSYYYGASNIVDAYVVATTIPMVFFSFVGTGIETSLIPMLSKLDKESGDKEKFISNIVNVFAIFCFVIILIVHIFPVPVVNLFASGFNGETMDIAVSFTKFSIVGIIFSTLTYIYLGLLHYRNKFIAAAFSTILMDVVVLLFVYLSSKFGVIFLSIGNVIALLIQALFLRVFIHHRHSFKINFNDEYLHEMIAIIIPVIIGVSVNQINLLVDQTIASRITVGGISYLNYANKVLAVVQGVFIISFISLLFPKMAEMLRLRNIEKLRNNIKNWAILLEFVLVPCTIVFVIYAGDIIKLLFQRGNFTINDTYFTSIVLLFYAIELPFYGLRELLSRVYYAYGNTKLPMHNSLVGLFVKVAVSIPLSYKLGLVGLPIGTTVSCIVTCCFIIVKYLRDHVGENRNKFFVPLIILTVIFTIDGSLIACAINQLLVNDGYWYLPKIILTFVVYTLVNGFLIIKINILDINTLRNRFLGGYH